MYRSYITIAVLAWVFIPCLYEIKSLADDIPTSAKEIEEGASSEAIDAGILLYFSEVQYSDLEQGRFLLKLIERLKATGDPKVAPALAALLNRPGVYERYAPHGNAGSFSWPESRLVEGVLSKPATDAWFHIMWPHLDEQQRVDAILNVIMERPEIYFRLTDLVKQRAQEIGESFRPAFYQYIMNPKDAYTWRNVRYPRSNVVTLWRMFPPTKMETQAILEKGSVGIRVAYLYAFGDRQKDYSLKLYQQLLEETKGRHDAMGKILVYAIMLHDLNEETRARFRVVLFEVTDWILDDFEHDRIDHWSFGIIFSVSKLIYDYGYTEQSLAYLKKIQTFFKNYDPAKINLPNSLKERLPNNINRIIRSNNSRIKRWENRE